MANTSVALFEAMLLDRGGVGNGPTEEKATLIFRTLDKVIPHLGVHTKLVSMCRDELFDAVYSNELTTSTSGEDIGYIQHLPFFVLVRRLFHSRDETNENLLEMLEITKRKLAAAESRHEESIAAINKLESLKRDRDEHIDMLSQNLTAERETIERLQMELNRKVKETAENERVLKYDISSTQKDLLQARESVKHLSTYKENYDRLNFAYQRWNNGKVGVGKLPSTVANKETNLAADVENCSRLEQQLLMVQNAIIEEYDRFLEDRTVVKIPFPISSILGVVRQDDSNPISPQMSAMHERFRNSIDDVNTELELLRQHRVQLETQLHELNEQHKAKQEENNKKKDGVEADEGGAVDDGQEVDPFIAHEEIFNKFAAMLYTSDNNGRTFYEFKDAKFCPSCAEKTVLCPHKILNREHVFPLPLSVTHIKVARPKVRVRPVKQTKLPVCRIEDDDVMSGTFPSSSEHLSRTTSRASTDDDIYDIDRVTAETYFSRSIQSVWEDYQRRTNIHRAIPRPLTLERTVSMIHQFGSALVQNDNHTTKNEPVKSVVDSLYAFIHRRYDELETSFLAAHDLLSAVLEYANTSKMSWLLAHVLAGNLDAAALRYILLLRNLIDSAIWNSVDDFRKLASVIYPFLNDDDLDSLHIAYVSFGENKISKMLIIDYIIYTITKYREPRFLQMDTVLMNLPGKELSFMTEEEYVCAADEALPLTSDRPLRHLYREAAAYDGQGGSLAETVPVLKLAQITSYLSLLGTASRVKNEIEMLFSRSGTH